MSAAQLLKQARAAGIVLYERDGRLCYEAPAGRVTPELRKLLSEHKAAILDLLKAERTCKRRIVMCGNCAHYLPSLPIYRSSGAALERPGGCVQGRTYPKARPPIYPSTGWYCDGWTSRSLQ